jgi:hypothetical protein
MAENFIYNPAEKIAGAFNQANTSLGSAFATVLARKQHDYDVADHIFQNLESLKKDVNLFGREEVKKMVSQTMGEMANNISQTGNLDYAKLGLVRNKISEIKDRKEYWESFADIREEKFKQLIADKDYLKSFANSVKDIDALAFDKTITNAKDLATRMDEQVMGSYDPVLYLKKISQSVRPNQNVDGYYKDGKGYTIGYNGKLPAGMGYDPAKKQLIDPQDPDWATKDLQSLEGQNPEMMRILKKNITGVAGAFNSDEEIYKHFFKKTIENPEEKVIGQPKVWKPTKGGGGSPKNTTFGAGAIGEIKVPEAGGNIKKMPTGKPIKIAVQPGQEGIISSVGRNAKGEIWVETYYKSDGSLWTDENDLAGAKTGWNKIQIPEDDFINRLEAVAGAGAYAGGLGDKLINGFKSIKKATGKYVDYMPPADSKVVGIITNKATGEEKKMTRKDVDNEAEKNIKNGKIKREQKAQWIKKYSQWVESYPEI